MFSRALSEFTVPFSAAPHEGDFEISFDFFFLNLWKKFDILENSDLANYDVIRRKLQACFIIPTSTGKTAFEHTDPLLNLFALAVSFSAISLKNLLSIQRCVR